MKLRPQYVVGLIIWWAVVLGGCAMPTLAPAPPAPAGDQNLVHESAFAHYYQGLTHKAQQDWPAALQDFQQAHLLDPKAARPLLQLALCQLHSGDHQQALRQLKQACALAPDQDAEFALQAAQLYEQLGATAEAIVLYQQAIQQDRSWPSPYFYLARLYESMGAVEQALQVLRQALAVLRDRARIYWQMGLITYRAVRYRQAIGYFQQALAADPRLQAPRNIALLAATYEQAGELSHAVAVLQDFLHKWHERRAGLPLQLTLARLYLKQGARTSAQALYQRLQRQFPQEPAIALALSNMYEQQHNLPAAIRTLTHFLKQRPAAAVLRRLGKIYNTRQDYARALDYLSRAADQEPACGETFYLLGIAYEGLHQYDQAQRNLEKALQHPPYPLATHLHLAHLYLRGGKELDLARRHLLVALYVDPENQARYLGSLARIDRLQGHYRQARDKWLQALAAQPSAEILEALGDLYLAMGLLRKALAYWQRAQALAVDARYLREKSARVRALLPHQPPAADAWRTQNARSHPRSP